MITTDPPPPVEAAASSLLYSKEFYAIVKPRLREGGILQEWFPGADAGDHCFCCTRNIRIVSLCARLSFGRGLGRRFSCQLGSDS